MHVPSVPSDVLPLPLPSTALPHLGGPKPCRCSRAPLCRHVSTTYLLFASSSETGEEPGAPSGRPGASGQAYRIGIACGWAAVVLAVLLATAYPAVPAAIKGATLRLVRGHPAPTNVLVRVRNGVGPCYVPNVCPPW